MYFPECFAMKAGISTMYFLKPAKSFTVKSSTRYAFMAHLANQLCSCVGWVEPFAKLITPAPLVIMMGFAKSSTHPTALRRGHDLAQFVDLAGARHERFVFLDDHDPGVAQARQIGFLQIPLQFVVGRSAEAAEVHVVI